MPPSIRAHRRMESQSPPTVDGGGKKSPNSSLDSTETRLDDGYEPHPFDVICRRDRERIQHVGNNRFRLCVEMRVDRYIEAKSRNDKTMILREIIEVVRSSGGRFIRPEEFYDSSPSTSTTRRRRPPQQQRDEESHINHSNDDEDLQDDTIKTIYFDIGNKKAADKVGHAMRAALSARGVHVARDPRRNSWPCVGASTTAAANSNNLLHPWNGKDTPLQETLRRQTENALQSNSTAVNVSYDADIIKRRASVAGLSYHNGWNQKSNTESIGSPTLVGVFADALMEPRKPLSRQSPSSSATDESVTTTTWPDDDDDDDEISLSSNNWELNDLREKTEEDAYDFDDIMADDDDDTTTDQDASSQVPTMKRFTTLPSYNEESMEIGDDCFMSL